MSTASALKDSGRISEAVAAWEQVLRLNPGEPTATEELGKTVVACLIDDHDGGSMPYLSGFDVDQRISAG